MWKHFLTLGEESPSTRTSYPQVAWIYLYLFSNILKTTLFTILLYEIECLEQLYCKLYVHATCHSHIYIILVVLLLITYKSYYLRLVIYFCIFHLTSVSISLLYYLQFTQSVQSLTLKFRQEVWGRETFPFSISSIYIIHILELDISNDKG